MIEVYNPATYMEEKKVARMPLVLNDKRVGFLSNSKPNTDLLYNHMAKWLPSQFQTSSIISSLKANAAQPAPGEILEKLGQETEIVINGVGD